MMPESFNISSGGSPGAAACGLLGAGKLHAGGAGDSGIQLRDADAAEDRRLAGTGNSRRPRRSAANLVHLSRGGAEPGQIDCAGRAAGRAGAQPQPHAAGTVRGRVIALLMIGCANVSNLMLTSWNRGAASWRCAHRSAQRVACDPAVDGGAVPGSRSAAVSAVSRWLRVCCRRWCGRTRRRSHALPMRASTAVRAVRRGVRAHGRRDGRTRPGVAGRCGQRGRGARCSQRPAALPQAWRRG